MGFSHEVAVTQKGEGFDTDVTYIWAAGFTAGAMFRAIPYFVLVYVLYIYSFLKPLFLLYFSYRAGLLFPYLIYLLPSYGPLFPFRLYVSSRLGVLFPYLLYVLYRLFFG